MLNCLQSILSARTQGAGKTILAHGCLGKIEKGAHEFILCGKYT
ncbi:hypothetical protein [Pontibacter arcticus]|nr:hypothetical protein [Pontibacter arcticus]